MWVPTMLHGRAGACKVLRLMQLLANGAAALDVTPWLRTWCRVHLTGMRDKSICQDHDSRERPKCCVTNVAPTKARTFPNWGASQSRAGVAWLLHCSQSPHLLCKAEARPCAQGAVSTGRLLRLGIHGGWATGLALGCGACSASIAEVIAVPVRAGVSRGSASKLVRDLFQAGHE